MKMLTLNELLKDYNWGIGDKPINAAKCGKCGTIAVSLYRHDFQYCKCRAIHVDGGFDYNKRGWKEGVEIIEIPDFTEEDIETLRTLIAGRYDASHK